MTNGNLVIPSDRDRHASKADVPGAVIGMRPPEENGMQFGQVLHSLRRQWLAAVVLGLLCAAPIAVGAWLLQSPTYTSSAYLRISASEQPLAFRTVEQAGRDDYRTFKSTQRQLMITPFVLNKALSREDIMNLPVVRENENPLEWLQEALVVSFPGDAEILQVSLTNADRQAAMKLVNAVVGAYKDEVIESERLARVQRLENLERVYNETETKARQKRSDLRQLAETLGTSDSETLSLAQQGSVQHYGLVRNELAQVRFDLMRSEGELDFLTSSNKAKMEAQAVAGNATAEPGKQENSGTGQTPAEDKGNSANSSGEEDADGSSDASEEIDLESIEYSETEMNEAIASDPISVKLQAELERFEEAKYTLTPAAYERYRQTNEAAISTLESRLEKRREHLVLLIKERLAQQLLEGRSRQGSIANNGLVVPAEVDNSLPELRVHLGVLRQQEKTLAKEVAELENEVRTFGRSSVEVEMMRSEIESLDEIVQQLNAEIERTKIELRQAPRITLLSEAKLGVVSDKKRPLMITAAAAFAGFMLPAGLLLLRDFSKKHLSDLPTTRDELGLEILGTIPKLPRGIVRKPKSLSVDLGSFEDQVRDSSDSVAATILRRAADQQCQVLLISSAMPREGKSSLACHLAISLAHAGRKVVVVDFDLRRPSMHAIFDCPISPGVGELLVNHVKLDEAIQPTNIPNVDLIPAGSSEQSIPRSATSGRLAELYRELRSLYDFVIVDAGPVLGAPSTRLLAQPQYADGVILSIFKDVSQVTLVEDAKRILTSFGAPIIGTVLSGYTSGMYYSYTNRPTSTVEVEQ
ncbi:polysaccharide biosynthesis tyrosine autokinase [Blastopirellula marina]|uniref:AAA domain-containing protein n=1 Tax=Blastopirellula marina TaxID=124 RepID=A0A2S8F9B8_9BACT|nr:tyrosine-protein kinase domain-containing protein [Blastopirellula marina]PQO28756.1 hypothetical protein C5Y98_23535 [Blastopirellula marina]PTL42029.1 hypothetical protein C5Y97_23550 [Blastopirellula marina]